MRIKITMKDGTVHKHEAVRKIEQFSIANMASPKEDESASEPYLLVTLLLAGTMFYRCRDIKSIKIGMEDSWNDNDSD